MKILFHFGAHKTASTHLQFNLALNRPYLNSLGIAYFRFQEIEGLQRKADELAAHFFEESFDTQGHLAWIKNCINQNISGYDTAIITYEGCLGYHDHVNFSDIYPYAQPIMAIYQSILKEHEVQPIYAIRDYNGFIKSTYQQELAHGVMLSTIDDYFGNKKLSPQRWTQIIEALQSTFSEEVKVFCFEEYKRQAEAIIIRLLSLTGKEIDKNQLVFENNKRNTGKSTVQLKFNFSLNGIFNRLPDFKYKKALYYRSIKHVAPLLDNGIGNFLLKDYQKKELPVLIPSEKYEHERKHLLKSYGLLKSSEESNSL